MNPLNPVSIGVSVGSENVVLAVSSTPGRQDVVADDMGERCTPMYVNFSPEEVLVGAAARNAGVRKPRNTVHAVLALLSAKEASAVRPYKPTCEVEDIVPEGADGQPDYEADSQGITLPSVADWGEEDQKDCDRTPEDVAIEFFTRLRTLVTNACGGAPVSAVVVGVPRDTDASEVLDALRRSELADKGATLRVVAADTCIAAAADPAPFTVGFTGAAAPTVDASTTLVIDWGANVLRVSAIVARGSSLECVVEEAVIGKIGGKQLDRAIADAVAEAFRRKTRCDPRDEARSMRKLHLAAASAKTTLSVAMNTSIEIEAFCNGIDLAEPVSRMKVDLAFDGLGAAAILDSTVASVVAKLSAAGAPDVSRVALAGGMCRVPRAQANIKTTAQKHVPKATVVDTIPADEITAIGACIAAQTLPGQRASWVATHADAPTLAGALVCASATAGAPPTVLACAGTQLPVSLPIKLPAPAAAPLGLALGTAQGDSLESIAWHGVAEVPEKSAVIEIAVDAHGAIKVVAGPTSTMMAEIAQFAAAPPTSE
jgi:molecular chaperone DnaK (HSP70)